MGRWMGYAHWGGCNQLPDVRCSRKAVTLSVRSDAFPTHHFLCRVLRERQPGGPARPGAAGPNCCRHSALAAPPLHGGLCNLITHCGLFAGWASQLLAASSAAAAAWLAAEAQRAANACCACTPDLFHLMPLQTTGSLAAYLSSLRRWPWTLREAGCRRAAPPPTTCQSMSLFLPFCRPGAERYSRYAVPRCAGTPMLHW